MDTPLLPPEALCYHPAYPEEMYGRKQILASLDTAIEHISSANQINAGGIKEIIEKTVIEPYQYLLPADGAGPIYAAVKDFFDGITKEYNQSGSLMSLRKIADTQPRT